MAGLLWTCGSQQRGAAQDEPKYVGSEVCAGCHKDVSKSWAFTVHHRTLHNKDASKSGCEACHGPGGEHVAGGGDRTRITRLSRLKPAEASEVCLKCHTSEHVTLWHTGTHARAKVTCMNCHDPHSPGEKTLLSDVENAKHDLDGLVTALKQAELAAGQAEEGSAEKAAANKRVDDLKAEKEKLQKELKGVETLYQRAAEPYVCYSCHKAQKVQGRLPSHHPIVEGKMKCSSCHNPHGGPNRMLKQESVIETCHRCHADKVGPFTFEHVPVTEDCTICHSPHGSVQNNLLVQSQPFLCLKCHAGPHSRSRSLDPTLAPPGASFSVYYTECTDCHSQVHGSDSHVALHY